MDDLSLGLELSPAQREELGSLVLAYLGEFFDSRSDAPASFEAPNDALVSELLAPPPESGRDLSDALRILSSAVDTGFDTTVPGFLSYIPTGGIFTSALGSFLAAGVNRYTGGYHAAPGAVAIELSVIKWMTGLFGLPETAGGILLSGGSVANLTAVVTARSQLGEAFQDGVIYTSARSHHSVNKAARIAGIAGRRVRSIATESDLRMDMSELRSALVDDRRAGLRPMMIVGTAGTTDTGSIDPLPEIAELAAEWGTWFHADAAYGGFFQLTRRGREQLRGIELADSITVDAHKSLFLPFGVGGLLVRDVKPLIQAHEGQGAYMQDVEQQELPHFFSMGPELTRPNRGMAVWLPLQLHGVNAFREVLDDMLDLAEWTSDQMAQIDGIELACVSPLSITAFYSVTGNRESQRIFQALLDSKEVHISSTTIDDRFVIRLAFLSHRTTRVIAQRVVEIVQAQTRN